MPIPKPKDDESKKDFLDRCMGNDTMNEEYPDNKQRYAVCNSAWKKAKEKKSMGKVKFEMVKDIERRVQPLEDVELRVEPADDKGNGKKLVGYVARFNKPSEDLGGFTEKIAPGAFRDTIKGDDIRALKNHNPDWVLGRTTNGTLRLSENSRGLKMEVDLPDTSYARDLAVSIDRGDITGQSFGFHTLEDSWEVKKRDGEEVNIRTLEKVALIDVGPVTFPAYPQTEVAIRAMHKWQKSEQDKEKRQQEEENEHPPEPMLDGEQEQDPVPMHKVSVLKRQVELKEKALNL